MAPSAALIIACAALAAVILQANIQWTTEAKPASASGRLSSSSSTLGASAMAVPHEARTAVPPGWSSLGSASGSTQINMRIALASQDAPGLQQALMDVSTPGHPKYGQHLSAAQAQAYIAPSPATVKAVADWLASEGVAASVMPGHGDWLGFSTTVSQAGRLFNASFSNYRHTSSGSEHVRTLAYSIPEHLKPHIELVHPMTSFTAPKGSRGLVRSPKPRPRRWASRDANFTFANLTCAQVVTPSCIQQSYGLPLDPATSPGNSITVTGYQSEFPQLDDLQSFLQQFRPDMDSSTEFTLQTLDGGSDPQDPSQAGDEGNLDIQYTVGIATGVPVNFLSVKDSMLGSDLTGLLDTVNFLSSASEEDLPTVMTTSYGYDEATLSPALMTKLCNAIGCLGARGVSVLFASGDGGVAGAHADECTQFVPEFPASCPYVTAVGATTDVPETAAFLSAGGFSNVFDAPSYQTDAIQTYFSSLGDEYAGLFNTSGRGYPDVAAYGMRIPVVNSTANILLGGTSASSPIFASVIALVNDRLLAAGNPPLGFLNPWLYQNPSALNDVPDGSNPGCGTDGFPGIVGWDPVTGLGSPNFPAMLAAAGVEDE